MHDDMITRGGGSDTEAAKRTDSLVGDLFVQPVTIDYKGKPAIVFAFPDLSVKLEGEFILRYRAFEIYSRPDTTEDIPVIAQCYGGTFRVYSTKDFPGLRPSTDLTKTLARWGVRLNVRETERKRRKTLCASGNSTSNLAGSAQPLSQ
jgi:hypothetical protein